MIISQFSVSWQLIRETTLTTMLSGVGKAMYKVKAETGIICVIVIQSDHLKTHHYLLPLLCHRLPVFDEICGRTMNFVCSRKQLSTSLILWDLSRAVLCTAVDARSNVLFCLRHYNWTFDEQLSRHSFNQIVSPSNTTAQYAVVSLLYECLMVQMDKFSCLIDFYTAILTTLWRTCAMCMPWRRSVLY